MLGALACGKKGDPLPPLRPTPAAVAGVRVAQRGDRLEISFMAPRASTDGARLPVLEIELLVAQGEGEFVKLARVRKFSAAPGEAFVESETLPPPGTYVRAGARAVAKGHRGNLGEPARLIVVEPLAAPRNLAAELVAAGVALAWEGEIPPPAPPPPTPAPRPTPTPKPGSGPAPKTPPSETPSTPPAAEGPPAARTSPPAPETAAPETAAPAATVPTAPAPEPPVPPATAPAVPPATESAAPATATAEGPPPTPKPTPTPFDPGFFVYRRPAQGRYAAALGGTATAERKFTDGTVQPGESWCYEVRAAAAAEPRVESPPSNEVCLEVKDVQPPAAPTGVTALAREDGVEIRWSRSPEPDVVSYRIYRSLRAGERERVGEVAAPETVFLDTEAPTVRALRYTLTAMDKAGHESAGTSTPEVRRPQ
jgi:hypothetical protein